MGLHNLEGNIYNNNYIKIGNSTHIQTIFLPNWNQINVALKSVLIISVLYALEQPLTKYKNYIENY